MFWQLLALFLSYVAAVTAINRGISYGNTSFATGPSIDSFSSNTQDSTAESSTAYFTSSTISYSSTLTLVPTTINSPGLGSYIAQGLGGQPVSYGTNTESVSSTDVSTLSTTQDNVTATPSATNVSSIESSSELASQTTNSTFSASASSPPSSHRHHSSAIQSSSLGLPEVTLPIQKSRSAYAATALSQPTISLKYNASQHTHSIAVTSGVAPNGTGWFPTASSTLRLPFPFSATGASATINSVYNATKPTHKATTKKTKTHKPSTSSHCHQKIGTYCEIWTKPEIAAQPTNEVDMPSSLSKHHHITTTTGPNLHESTPGRFPEIGVSYVSKVDLPSAVRPAYECATCTPIHFIAPPWADEPVHTVAGPSHSVGLKGEPVIIASSTEALTSPAGVEHAQSSDIPSRHTTPSINLAATNTADIIIGGHTFAVPVPPATSAESPVETGAAPIEGAAGSINALSMLSSAEQMAQIFAATASRDGSAGSETHTYPAAAALESSNSQPEILPQGVANGFLTIGSQVFSIPSPAAPGNVIVVGSATLVPGGPEVTINGQLVSALTGGLVVGSSQTIALAVSRPSSGAVFQAGGATYTAINQNGASAAIVNGVTFSVDGAAQTVNGQAVSLATNGVVIGDHTVVFSSLSAQTPTITQGAVFTANSPVFTAQRGSNSDIVMIGGSTLSIGGPAQTIAGSQVSAVPNGIVVDGQTTTFTSSPDTTPLAVFSQAGHALSIAQGSSPGLGVIDGTTLTAGGSAVTTAGVTLSAVSGGLLVNGQTITYSRTAPDATPTVVITPSAQAITASASSRPGAAVVGSQTLIAGGPGQIIAGETVSAVSNAVVVNGHTITFSSPYSTETDALTFTGQGSTTYTALSDADSNIAIIDGQTLSAGGPGTTINGLSMSAIPSGVVVNGQTMTFSSLAGPMTEAATFTGAQGKIYTAFEAENDSTAPIDGTVLSVGGNPITLDGQTITLSPSGLVKENNGQSSTIPFTPVNGPVTTSLAEGVAFTAGSQTLTATKISQGVFALGSYTLTAGRKATVIAGETISAAATGLVVDGSMIEATALNVQVTSTSFLTSTTAAPAEKVTGTAPSSTSTPTSEGSRLLILIPSSVILATSALLLSII